MPNYYLQNSGVVIASTDQRYVFQPGQVNFHTVATFSRVQFTGVPNVVATTGNPHWTVHPIWVNPAGAGFVINRKSPAAGAQEFSTYFLFMGPGFLRGATGVEIEFEEIDEEGFEALRKEHETPGNE